jgi:molybdopterin converting factor small subunit
MCVSVNFYSYFKDLTGCAQTSLEVASGATLGQAVDALGERFPKLAGMRKSMLAAVGVDYQDASYVLKQGEEISLFPPVQGG